MNKKYIIIAGAMGLFAVALGAFGAHGLKDILTQDLLENYKTGVLYHLTHSVVLLSIALSNLKILKKSFWTIFTGIILFSFSLYLFTISGISWLVLITPLGGICLLIGWLMIILAAIKNKESK